jgi:hypothetical protein
VFSQYKKGYVVDKYNQVFFGLVNYEGKHKVKFKENKESEVEVLGIEDVKAFSVEADSFVTIHYQDFVTDVKIDCFSKVLLKGPDNLICKEMVYEDLGKKSVYNVHSPNGMPTATDTKKKVALYLVQHKGSFYQIGKESFYIDMPKVISDHEALCKMIISKTLTFKDMDEIIEEYETWRKLKNHF